MKLTLTLRWKIRWECYLTTWALPVQALLLDSSSGLSDSFERKGKWREKEREREGGRGVSFFFFFWFGLKTEGIGRKKKKAYLVEMCGGSLFTIVFVFLVGEEGGFEIQRASPSLLLHSPHSFLVSNGIGKVTCCTSDSSPVHRPYSLGLCEDLLRR